MKLWAGLLPTLALAAEWEGHTGLLSFRDLKEFESWSAHHSPDGAHTVAEKKSGNWGDMWNCPLNYYLCGLKVRTQDGGLDQAGVTGYQLKCCSRDRASDGYNNNGNGGDIADQIELHPADGDKFGGKWSKWTMCPKHSFIRGINVKSVPDRGLEGDDIGIAQVSVDCHHLCVEDNNDFPSALKIDVGLSENDVPFDWIHPQGIKTVSVEEEDGTKYYLTHSMQTWEHHSLDCGSERAICGIASQWSPDWAEDQEAITGIRVQCCAGLLNDVVDIDTRRRQEINCF